MAGMLDGLQTAAARLTVRQKFQLLAGVAATVAVVWGLSAYTSRIRYGVLFSNLRQDDAAPVIAALKEKHVAFRLAPGGSAIEVPAEQVDELRMELAGDGLPRGGGVGFEIFDKPSFGVSDFVQNLNYRRALERELARTIQGLDVVESSRVHLALPPPSVFAGERREPSASVVVRLRSGRGLSGNQVGAITHLVASGVEGLDPARVSVIDGDGHMLSEGAGDDGSDSLSASQLDAKRAMESGIESTLVTILEPVVGKGRVRASATVELNMARVQKVEESYDPDSAVVRSEQKSKTRRQGGGTGGIPGTASNLPTGTPAAAAGTSNADESQTSTTNYEIGKVVSTIAQPAGQLVRQSVAVVVDNAPSATKDAKPSPRAEEEMRKITDLVRAAAGIDENRGDLLIVANSPFDETASVAAELQADSADRWHFFLQLAKYLAPLLAVLLVVFLVIRPAIGVLRTARTPGALGSGAPPTVAELQASLAGGATGPGGGKLRRQLMDAAATDPEAAALVVRGWLEHKG